jgi:hypothetical protein
MPRVARMMHVVALAIFGLQQRLFRAAECPLYAVSDCFVVLPVVPSCVPVDALVLLAVASCAAAGRSCASSASVFLATEAAAA